MTPFTLLIKPSGSQCNIDCEYCFYHHRAPEIGAGKQRMTQAVLEGLVRDYLRLGFPQSTFAWQGGEPALMGLDFFRRAVQLQEQYGRPGQQVGNALQTNGILLDEAWGQFLHDKKFLVGISIDGPEALHNHYRIDYAGGGTWDKVLRGIEICQRHDVEFNALVVINRVTADHPDEILDFFLEKEIRFLQFIPCVEQDPHSQSAADFCVTPEQYGEFLVRVFDRWLEIGPTTLSIRDFDSMVQYCITGRHSICTYAKQCDGYVVVEHSGDVYPCDFFVRPDMKVGNLTETPIAKLAASAAKREFARGKRKLNDKCLVCRHLEICRGGCPKDRMATGSKDWSTLSYFCESYLRFFDHAKPKLSQLAAQLNAQMRA